MTFELVQRCQQRCLPLLPPPSPTPPHYLDLQHQMFKCGSKSEVTRTEREKLRTFWMRSGAEMAPSTRSIRFFSSCMSACLWSWEEQRKRVRVWMRIPQQTDDVVKPLLPSASSPESRCLRVSTQSNKPDKKKKTQRRWVRHTPLHTDLD